MGALDTLQDFVKAKLGKEVKKELTNAHNAATPGRGDTSHGEFGGFPFINYASERITLRPMMVPRQKYTYGVEFHINEDALLDGVAITNISKFVTNGNLYTQLKRIDHPKPAFAVETLRSYNKYVKLPTKMEFPPASMTFDDDNTSITAALIKEYINFYSHSGDVGTQLLSSGNTSDSGPVHPPNFNSGFADTAFSFDEPNVGYNHLISNSATDQPRANMNTRPSMGLRLKPNYKRHFFNSIVIYDLGTEPNSVNIYYFYRPIITTIDHAGLDTEDRTSKVEITMNFEYENYYFAVGRNRVEVADAVELLTGIRPTKDITNNFFPNYHGAMEEKPNNTILPVSKASPNPMTPTPDVDSTPQVILGPGTIVPTTPTRPPGEIQSEIDIIRQELGELASSTSSTGGDDAEAEAERARLTNKLKLLNAELEVSTTIVSEIQKIEQAAPATQSAVENTQKQIDAATTPTDAVIKNAKNGKFDGKTSLQWRDNATKSTQQAENIEDALDIIDVKIESNNSGKTSLPSGQMESLILERDRLNERAIESHADAQRANEIADALDKGAQAPLT